MSRLDEVWELYEELVWAQRGRPVEALATLDNGRAQELRSPHGPSERQPIQSLIDQLPKGTSALVYFSLPQRLLIWHIDLGRVRLIERDIARPTLTDLAQAFARDPSSSVGKELARLLLPTDFRSGLDGLVVIVPDVPLADVQFAALPQFESRLLVQDANLVVVPSLAVLQRSTHQPKMAKALLIASADAQPGEGLPALPLALSEIQNAAAVYGDVAVSLWGINATPKSVAAALPLAATVHFAGHSVPEPTRPDSARLLLFPPGDRGALTARRISTLDLATGALVILSSCSAAAGQAISGEGTLSLARPFLQAGAGGVIGSMRAVADEDAARLFAIFHRNRVDRRMMPAIALADAQRTLLQQQSGSRTWLSFVYIGGIHVRDT